MAGMAVRIHPLACSGIRSIMPYQPGTSIQTVARQTGLDPSKIIKLASNENPLGSIPQAILAAQQALTEVNRYPECGCLKLADRLGKQIEVDPERILFVDSSNEGINYICRAFLEPDENIVISQVSFPMYPIGALYQGAKVIKVPNRGYDHDLQAIIKAITPKTKLVFIDNPNNPLGTIVPSAQFDEYFRQVPDHVITVIDEAYDRYVEDLNYPDSRLYQKEFQAIVLRTFSKLYGLAGLRIGYLFADPLIIETLHRAHAPFYLQNHHQAAISAALEYGGNFIEKTLEINHQGKIYLYDELKRLGVAYVPTEANFIFYPCSNPSGIYERFLDFGIIIRPVGNIGIRVTIGLPEQNESFIRALETIQTEGLI